MRAAGSTAVAVPVAMFAAASFWLSIKYLVKPGIWMTERVRPRLLDARRRGPRSRSRTLPAPMGMKTPGKNPWLTSQNGRDSSHDYVV
ncbi:hypothetical protein [Mycobacterium conspicuum]|uniref:hypothetical protein n=1 Tax=Mycobacterium conspicuum TaxID=44010 RepID=UPI000A147237|nr:hypothetical protein [Mycobacterium conspicuum]ORV43095.1 hypothetical protein AWC00_10545 [Mycobacterium conspicuum]